MMGRLIRLEVTRLTLRPRALLSLGLMACASLYPYRGRLSLHHVSRGQIAGLLALTVEIWLPMLIPILVGVAVAGSFAEDRRTGYVRLVLARGASHQQYIIARALAMAISGGLITLASLVLHVLLVFVQLPLDLPAVARPPYDPPGPVQALFVVSPLLNDVVAIAMVSLAGAALTLTGLLVSLLVRNELLAAVAPFGFVLGSALWISELLANPAIYLGVWFEYSFYVPEVLRPYAAFGFWFLFGAAMLTLCTLLFTRREMV